MQTEPTPESPEPILSASALARRLNVPDVRINRLIAAGRLKPDMLAGDFRYFFASRLEAIAQLLQ